MGGDAFTAELQFLRRGGDEERAMEGKDDGVLPD